MCLVKNVQQTLCENHFTSHFDPMYGPAVRCKKFRRIGGGGLASMYPAFDWSHLLRAIMDISARAFSLADRPRLGHLGHQCSHALGRPNLHLVSSSRRPRRVTIASYIIACSSYRAGVFKRVGRWGSRLLSKLGHEPDRPGDAGKLVGQRDREHVVVQPLLGGLDPGLEPVAFPALSLTSTTHAACTNRTRR